jgi:hypothetical protein
MAGSAVNYPDVLRHFIGDDCKYTLKKDDLILWHASNPLWLIRLLINKREVNPR